MLRYLINKHPLQFKPLVYKLSSSSSSFNFNTSRPKFNHYQSFNKLYSTTSNMPGTRTSTEEIILEVLEGGFALITINVPKKKNALSVPLFKRLSAVLQAVDKREDVFCVILTGKGDFFSAGADVKAARDPPGPNDDNLRTAAIRRLSECNLDLARSCYQHSKILVAALNGPAIGLSAAILGHFDFIYAVENAYMQTPFTSLSLVCEGGASMSFPRRMGIVKANEALIMGKRLGAAELQQNGFVNKVFAASVDDVFIGSLMSYLRDRFDGVDQEACLISKKLIKATLPDPDPSNLREIMAGADRSATGKPQAQFALIAAGAKRHKL